MRTNFRSKEGMRQLPPPNELFSTIRATEPFCYLPPALAFILYWRAGGATSTGVSPSKFLTAGSAPRLISCSTRSNRLNMAARCKRELPVRSQYLASAPALRSFVTASASPALMASRVCSLRSPLRLISIVGGFWKLEKKPGRSSLSVRFICCCGRGWAGAVGFRAGAAAELDPLDELGPPGGTGFDSGSFSSGHTQKGRPQVHFLTFGGAA